MSIGFRVTTKVDPLIGFRDGPRPFLSTSSRERHIGIKMCVHVHLYVGCMCVHMGVHMGCMCVHMGVHMGCMCAYIMCKDMPLQAGQMCAIADVHMQTCTHLVPPTHLPPRSIVASARCQCSH